MQSLRKKIFTLNYYYLKLFKLILSYDVWGMNDKNKSGVPK